ncbi:putative toxin-antitoxin system toxin component, PIN family [Trichothermofontia sp.]
MNKPRYILDTNVVVSALLQPRSVPRQAFDLAFMRGTVLISIATIDELDSVLRKPKFDRYISERDRLHFLAIFIQDSIIVDLREKLNISDCRDPKDNKFLELAVSGNADCIISGDDDLLDLHPFRGISIITPQGFICH